MVIGLIFLVCLEYLLIFLGVRLVCLSSLLCYCCVDIVFVMRIRVVVLVVVIVLVLMIVLFVLYGSIMMLELFFVKVLMVFCWYGWMC